MLPPGAVLDGKYEIKGPLGAGGMGEVYHATRTLLGDDVAIKLIRGTGQDPATLRERFLRESRTNARLRHPNIVAILDYNADVEGRPYLVMEYLNGPSLADELRARGPFELPTFRRVMAAVCTALQVAHDRGIVHRDLKLSNVMSHRYDNGEIVWKVIDFGLANLEQPGDARLTQAHEFIGTATYAAPEQLSGEPVDARTDVYSLGVIAFELLAGRPPFTGENMLTLLNQHLNTPPPELNIRRPDLPVHVARAVMRALAKAPDDRWPSVAQFLRALTDDPEPTIAAPIVEAPSGLGAYDVGRLIGRGRFGSEVREGTHRALGHPVAIRTVRLTGRGDREAVRARFLREAKALQVPHPNIVQVRDLGESGDVMYLVTDLLAGCSLAEALEREGPLPLPQLLDMVAQLADATAAIHRRGGLICGVHPGIIRVVRDADGERLAISSAGICSVQDLLATVDESTLRGQGSADGELPYVAPELLTGRPATPRSDVFTLGVLAYRMATGALPFDARTLPELIGSMLGAPPRRASDLRPDLGEPQVRCIERCLLADPAGRYATASEMRAAWLSDTAG